MYRVRPSGAWRNLGREGALPANALAALTSYMRNVLHEEMGFAIDEAVASGRIKSRNGAMRNQLKSGRRPKGSGTPGTVSETFLVRSWIAIHETGGTITPKQSRYLTIPMPAALRADGTLKRRSAASWSGRYKTFVLTSKKGNKFIAYRKRDGSLVLLYHLAPEVRMKKRLDLLRAIKAHERRVVAAWSRELKSIMAGFDFYGIAFEGKKGGLAWS